MMQRNSLALSQNGSQTKSSLPVARTALSALSSNFSIAGCGPSQFLPFAARVRDLPPRGVNERGKRDAKKDRNNELLHAFGAPTLGKRAFLIKRFRFFPSVDIR